MSAAGPRIHQRLELTGDLGWHELQVAPARLVARRWLRRWHRRRGTLCGSRCMARRGARGNGMGTDAHTQGHALPCIAHILEECLFTRQFFAQLETEALLCSNSLEHRRMQGSHMPRMTSRRIVALDDETINALAMQRPVVDACSSLRRQRRARRVRADIADLTRTARHGRWGTWRGARR